MLTKLLLFLSFLFLCTDECLAIFGGRHVTLSYPFFVVLRVQKQKEVICGGTIIAADAILTAAHCLFDFESKEWVDESDIVVIKNEFTHKYWREDPLEFSCQKYVPHRAFDPSSRFDPFDIAIVQLKECIDLTQPENEILKPCRGSQDYKGGLAIGVGPVKRNPVIYPNRLMGALLTKFYPCARIFRDSGIKIVEGPQICYGSSSGIPSGTSEGDAGGPLIAISTTGEPICLLGVSSFGEQSAHDVRFPSVFTNAEVYKLWIESQLLIIYRTNKIAGMARSKCPIM